MSTKTLEVSCSCGSTNHSFSVPHSSLPLSSHLCNCNISRQISGSLLTSYINVTHPTASIPQPAKPDTLNLTAYGSSEILRRWFCSTCGTHMYLEYNSDGHFEAATGTLVLDEGEADDVVRLESCMWIEDTGDGGASVWVKEIGGRVLERWEGEAGSSPRVPLVQSTTQSITASQAKGQALANTEQEEHDDQAIYAHCHCRAVEFWITPPDTTSQNASSPFPDLMIPHHLQHPLSANTSNHPWWLPNSRTRYLAGTCTCASCRAASGFDITFWAFIPTSSIFLTLPSLSNPSPTPFPVSGQWGSMRTFHSSPGVTRTFCSVCGANVFWNGGLETHGRRGLVDVAVGLLDARSGARAEEILAWWTGRVSFVEDARHQGLAKALETDLREWGKDREQGDGGGVAKFDGDVLGVLTEVGGETGGR
ncbi:hypothetical protein EK21DRAFT_81688 [Setomelanomma holmii]|uniref:CENP-V/GFA domain-containing protein n=1 Tax=Setomelanomma holmii TaxID=210430 RepID=A0A9P4GXP9_9PLEO|nr:hypothetical protein EK21DRAFT_81688 [Setomelanomma holmii]